jgi:hypothetical protein
METLDIFRLKPNGRVLWIGNAYSLQTARGIIKLLTVDPSEEFLILNDDTHETIIVRAEGCRGMPWKLRGSRLDFRS